MAHANDTIGILYQNLIDAGCGGEMTKRCIALAENGRQTELLDLLNDHRKDILDAIHQGQNKIDCLDYLIYRLKKGR